MYKLRFSTTNSQNIWPRYCGVSVIRFRIRNEAYLALNGDLEP